MVLWKGTQRWLVEEIILNPKGQKEIKIAWGTGHATNNKVEVLAMYQGLEALKDQGIIIAYVLANSTIIVRELVRRKIPSEMRIAKIQKGTTSLVHNFQCIYFYEIKRALNPEVDLMEYIGVGYLKGNCYSKTTPENREALNPFHDKAQMKTRPFLLEIFDTTWGKSPFRSIMRG